MPDDDTESVAIQYTQLKAATIYIIFALPQLEPLCQAALVPNHLVLFAAPVNLQSFMSPQIYDSEGSG